MSRGRIYAVPPLNYHILTVCGLREPDSPCAITGTPVGAYWKFVQPEAQEGNFSSPRLSFPPPRSSLCTKEAAYKTLSLPFHISMSIAKVFSNVKCQITAPLPVVSGLLAFPRSAFAAPATYHGSIPPDGEYPPPDRVSY